MNDNTSGTMQFQLPRDRRAANEIIMTVFSAMKEKGYDPVNQIVGYLLSGDPTYITSYNNAPVFNTPPGSGRAGGRTGSLLRGKQRFGRVVN